MTPSSPARLLVAPILATAAAGLSFWLNVPEGSRLSASHSTASKETTERGREPGVAAAKPRDIAETDRLWHRHASVEVENEPIEEAWARAHQEILNRVTVAARQTVFAGAPEPTQVVVGPRRCHTVRCRFSMCSPMAHEVGLLERAIRGANVAGESLWRHYGTAVVEPGDAMSPDDFCIEVTLAFASDDPDLDRIAFTNERAGADGTSGSGG